jgi:4-amino-4-deoxy-L-arabinose transferase-like glycosyltransferase
MLATHNWIAPTLNHVPYYDKPPGLYWMIAGMFLLFSPSEWAARFPAAAMGALTVVATLVFSWRRVGPAGALTAAAILCTTVFFVMVSRSVRMDVPLTFALTTALFYGYAVWEQPSKRTRTGTTPPPAASSTCARDVTPSPEPRRSPWPIYTAVGLGALVKGPVALVLPILVFAALTVTTGTYSRLRRFWLDRRTWLAIALGASWYVAAALYAPDQLWAFLWRHNLGRFVAADSGHPQPWWFFLWVLPAAFLPWALFLPGALRQAIRRARRGRPLDMFLLSWIVVVVGFFSLSRCKLATYMLPAFPPLAIIVGRFLSHASRAPQLLRLKVFRAPALLWTAAMLFVSLGIVVAGTAEFPTYARAASSGAVLAILPLAGSFLMRRGRWHALPTLIVLSTLAGQLWMYRAASGAASEFGSLKEPAILARDLPSASLYSFRTHAYSFTFYDGRSVKRIRSPEAAVQALGSTQPVMLITKQKQLDEIQHDLTGETYVWWQSISGRVLVSNAPPPAAAAVRTLHPTAMNERVTSSSTERRPASR